MRQLRVLLDANVLVDAQVRDLLLEMAHTGLIEVRWSLEILDELRRTLIGDLRRDPEKVDRLVAALERAFPEAAVPVPAAMTVTLDLPDPDDRHVLAAAIVGECDWLITENQRDFPDRALDRYDVLSVDIGEGLLLLASLLREHVTGLVATVTARMRRPPMEPMAWLRRLEQRHVMAAVGIGTAMGIDEYARSFDQMRSVHHPSSPQATVEALVDAVQEGRVADIERLIDPGLVIALQSAPSDEGGTSGIDVLRHRLQDVWTTDGWGWAAALRVQGVDVEVVKLVRARGEPQLARQETLVQGHVFVLQLQGGWVITGLDGHGEPVDPAWGG